MVLQSARFARELRYWAPPGEAYLFQAHLRGGGGLNRDGGLIWEGEGGLIEDLRYLNRIIMASLTLPPGSLSAAANAVGHVIFY